jgi:hypothetical protein
MTEELEFSSWQEQEMFSIRTALTEENRASYSEGIKVISPAVELCEA